MKFSFRSLILGLRWMQSFLLPIGISLFISSFPFSFAASNHFFFSAFSPKFLIFFRSRFLSFPSSFFGHLSFLAYPFRVSSFSHSFLTAFFLSVCTYSSFSSSSLYFFLVFLLCICFTFYLFYYTVFCWVLFFLYIRFALLQHTKWEPVTPGVLMRCNHFHSAARDGQRCWYESHCMGVKNGATLSKQTKVLSAHWCGNITKQHCNHHDDVPLETTQVTSLIMHQNVI